MKRIALLSLGVLLLATACNNNTKQEKETKAVNEPQQAPAETVASLAQAQD